MRKLSLILTIFVISGIWSSPALSAEPLASVELQVSARIINLAAMPVEDAIAFCDIHGMACPAIREQAQAAPVTAYEGQDWAYVDETGTGTGPEFQLVME